MNVIRLFMQSVLIDLEGPFCICIVSWYCTRALLDAHSLTNPVTPHLYRAPLPGLYSDSVWALLLARSYTRETRVHEKAPP